jgi:hypothetical protein
MQKHGFDGALWECAKLQGKAALAECARAGNMITYADFINHIRAITFTDAHDSRLPHFLEEISVEEDQQGRGLLTALVVHKNGDYKPGPGFFELAKKRGRNTNDIDKCWIEELKAIYAVWKA